MLLSALKKKSLFLIVILFGLIALITLSASLVKPSTQVVATTTKPTSYYYTPLSVDSKNFQSSTFSYTDNADLKRILFVGDILHELNSTLACQIRGVEPVDPTIDCIKALSAAPKERQQLLKKGGIIAFATDNIGTLYSQPASAIDYTKNIAADFGIQKVHAQDQGTGFNSLSQIQGIWILFRNIAYLLMVIVFVVLGILIMLRVNIDPRTVMTIQNTIPKAIIGIIIITFSYAIAGFLVDAMWIGTYFSVNTITQTQPPCYVENQDKPLSAVVTRGLLNNPIGFTTDLFGDEAGCQGTVDGIQGLSIKIASTIGDITSRVIVAALGGDEHLGSCGLGITGNSSIGNCVKLAIHTVLKLLFSALLTLIIFLAILVSLFRVWFNLLKGYVFLILDILLAPFWLLGSLLPGSSLSFTGWIRNIVAQLAVFPATALLFVLAAILANNAQINNPDQGSFLPPLVGNPNIADNIGALMAFGLILLTPELGNMIKEALKSPTPKAAGSISAITGFAAGKVMGSFGQASERYAKRDDMMLEKQHLGAAAARKGLFRIPFMDRPVG